MNAHQNFKSELRPLPMRITQLQFERLHAARARDGLSVQEHVRRALDQYLQKLEREAQRTTAQSPEAELPSVHRAVRRSRQSDQRIDAMIASSDHHLERMIVTREDGEAVWAERRLDQAAWAVVRPVRSAFQFHGSRQSS